VTLLFLSFAILCALALFGPFAFWTEPLWLLLGLERLTPNIVYHGRTRQPLVALSFDDGPHPTFTPQVLEILQRYDAKATFFLIGDRALRHPDLVEAIRAGGHEIGNHYSSNVPTLGHSDAKFVHNFKQTEVALGLSAKLMLFRPPGGIAWPRQIRLAKALGYACVLGSAYPHDPMHPPVRYIRWLIEKNLVPGAIVILHDGISDPSRGIEALPHILEASHRKGLRFVSSPNPCAPPVIEDSTPPTFFRNCAF
jgi:peptidoglycan-N-acetylglucosamine deacetylase